MQGKSIPKLGSLDQIETGSGDAEGRHSGDCDDEDGCGSSSGGGESRRKNHRVAKCECRCSLNGKKVLSPDPEKREKKEKQKLPRRSEVELVRDDDFKDVFWPILFRLLW